MIILFKKHFWSSLNILKVRNLAGSKVNLHPYASRDYLSLPAPTGSKVGKPRMWPGSSYRWKKPPGTKKYHLSTLRNTFHNTIELIWTWLWSQIKCIKTCDQVVELSQLAQSFMVCVTAKIPCSLHKLHAQIMMNGKFTWPNLTKKCRILPKFTWNI